MKRLRYAAAIFVAAFVIAAVAPTQAGTTATGITLTGPTATFTWPAVIGATWYNLKVDIKSGGGGIFNKEVGVATSQFVTGLPINGSTIYVTVDAQLGVPPGAITLNSSQFTYTAANLNPGPASVIVSPLPGNPLGSAVATFRWSASQATSYILMVGTTLDGMDIFNKNVGLNLAQIVARLPTDGTTVYVTLITVFPADQMTWNRYTYQAAANNGAAIMTSPVSGVQLTGSSATFTWKAGVDVSTYLLQVETKQGLNTKYIFNQSVGLATTQSVTGLPTDGSTIYVSLYTYQGPAPSAYSVRNDYSYRAAGGVPLARSEAPTPALAASSVAASPFATAVSGRTLPASVAVDQSPAAIANFPVLNGAQRQSFSSSRTKSTWQERANYSTEATADGIVDIYSKQLLAAGWQQTGRVQSGNAALKNLQFTLDLQNGRTHGHVVLAQNPQGGTNIALAVTTLFAGNSAPSLETTITSGPSPAQVVGPTSSPADRGAGDPTNFPRLPGSIRTSFTPTGQKASSQEVATYTDKCSPLSADAAYAHLADVGWDETSRNEDMNDVRQSDQISMTWLNSSRTATITLSGSQAGGTDVRVSITTPVSPPR